MPAQTNVLQLKQSLKEAIQKHAFIKFEKPVKLSSGSMTKEYFDGKQITLYPERMLLFAKIVIEEVDMGRIDAVGGLTMGADPIATAISLVAYLEKGLRIPAFLVRKDAKVHGLQKIIEGIQVKRGMNVMIVEDVITQGQATLTAIKAAQDAGAHVGQVVCLVDRQAGGSATIQKKYPLYSVFKKSDLDN